MRVLIILIFISVFVDSDAQVFPVLRNPTEPDPCPFDVGSDGTLQVCDSSISTVDLSAELTGDMGGIWTSGTCDDMGNNSIPIDANTGIASIISEPKSGSYFFNYRFSGCSSCADFRVNWIGSHTAGEGETVTLDCNTNFYDLTTQPFAWDDPPTIDGFVDDPVSGEIGTNWTLYVTLPPAAPVEMALYNGYNFGTSASNVSGFIESVYEFGDASFCFDQSSPFVLNFPGDGTFIQSSGSIPTQTLCASGSPTILTLPIGAHDCCNNIFEVTTGTSSANVTYIGGGQVSIESNGAAPGSNFSFPIDVCCPNQSACTQMILFVFIDGGC